MADPLFYLDGTSHVLLQNGSRLLLVRAVSTGSLIITQDDQTLAATGEVVVVGGLTKTQAPQTLVATGIVADVVTDYNTWYCNFGNGSSTGYYAVTVRPQNTVVAAGVIRRQFTAPAVGSERCFVCIVAGTTANTTDATWTTTRGAKTTDGTVTWQECTGVSAVNGDAANTRTWTQAKAVSSSATLGTIIKRDNGASYWICSTAGTIGASEPAWPSDTAGATHTDNTATWTCLGVVGNFTGGGAPHARLTNALSSTWIGSGGCTIYVGDNHAESQATTITTGGPFSTNVLNKILCCNHSSSYPPAAGDLTSGATVTTTAASANITIGASGSQYWYGVTFRAGSGASTGTANINIGSSYGLTLDNCSLQTLDTATGSKIFLGNAGAVNTVVLNNTSVKFGHTGHCFDLGNVGHYVWQNTSPGLVAGSAAPTNLFNWNNTNSQAKLTVEGVDLSAVAGNLVSYANPLLADIVFKDCKLHASATSAVAATRTNSANVQLIRCDSGANAFTSSRHTMEGVETTETAITRVGGAQDPAGQTQSRKIVTTALLSWVLPYKAEPYAIWNPTTGADVTVTVYGTINAGAVPNNDDIWMDVEYLGSSATPQGSIVTTTKASILAANAAVASDGSSWNGGGSGVGWSPFKLTTTLSSPQPGMAGYIEARVRAAKASTTYYLDPKIVLS